MAITITITDPQDHAPYELRVLAEYFQALANDKQPVPDIYSDLAKELGCTPNEAKARMLASQFELYKCGDKMIVRTTHDEELLSDEERAALRDTIAQAGLEESAAEAIAGTSKALRDQSNGPFMNAAKGLRASAGGDQEPYAVNAGGSDDFAELRDDPKPDASTPAAASDGKTAPAGLDSSGLPWDERIHSSSKAQNADGTWRYKRGGDLDERKRVEAELREDQHELKMAGTIAQVIVSQGEPEPDDDDIPPPPVEVEDDLPPPPPPPVEEEPVDMGKVFRAITEGQKAGLTQDKLAACLKAVGLTATQDIIGKPVEILAPLLQLIKEASV